MSDYRILVVDDNRAIHEDFRKILTADLGPTEVDHLAAELFDDVPVSRPSLVSKQFEIVSAYQGREGLQLVRESLQEKSPFALAFVDMRMPPGWDGLETISAIWEVEPEIHTVICTAHSDHSWSDIVEQLGENDRLLVIKKPFDAVEVVQCVHAMCEKWRLQRLDRERMEELEKTVAERTAHLREANAQLEKAMSERQRMEVDLRHAQKMESVGQLAAGVAHEINTPIQFVGDSLSFLRESFDDATKLINYYQELMETWESGTKFELVSHALKEKETELDIEYVLQNAPAAFQRSLDGIARVARIVRAMKEFAHPGGMEVQPANLNEALSTTLEVARSEYKMVADLDVELGDLPEVMCSVGDINQVFLNLVVNAAHAIEPTIETKGRGKISVRSWADEGNAWVSVSDSGTGIPEEIRHQIFDPFFTTKSVGKGTGQGLALAHAVVVERHGGSIEVESQVGEGSRFCVRLPIEGKPSSVRRSA